MRKLFSTLILLALAIWMIIACNRDVYTMEDQCNDLYRDYSDIMDTLSQNPSVAHCEDFRTAMSNYLQGCSLIPIVEREELEGNLEETDCSIYSK